MLIEKADPEKRERRKGRKERKKGRTDRQIEGKKNKRERKESVYLCFRLDFPRGFLKGVHLQVQRKHP